MMSLAKQNKSYVCVVVVFLYFFVALICFGSFEISKCQFKSNSVSAGAELRRFLCRVSESERLLSLYKFTRKFV